MQDKINNVWPKLKQTLFSCKIQSYCIDFIIYIRISTQKYQQTSKTPARCFNVPTINEVAIVVSVIWCLHYNALSFFFILESPREIGKDFCYLNVMQISLNFTINTTLTSRQNIHIFKGCILHGDKLKLK